MPCIAIAAKILSIPLHATLATLLKDARVFAIRSGIISQHNRRVDIRHTTLV
jgi:hypothetical protein